jgi:hypothetical protein
MLWPMHRLAVLALALVALSAPAQVFNLDHDRVQMAVLNGPMRFHTGDDPRWSQPAFDDSSWSLISSASSWSDQGYKDYGGFAWYRFTVMLPADRRQLGLYIPKLLTSYQVFADGKLVGSFGGFPPNAKIYLLRHHLLLLPKTNAAQMEISIRVWHWPHWALYYGGGFGSAPRIGDADQLHEWMILQDRNTFWQLSAQGYLALLNLLYCIAGLVLFLIRPKERLYLWYGLAGLFFCSWSLLNIFTAFYDLPTHARDLAGNALSVAGFVSFALFIWMMLGRRGTIWLWLGAGSVVANMLMWTLPPLLNLPVSAGSLILAIVNLPLILGPVVILIEGARRRDPDARLLLIPVGFNTLANWINDMLWVLVTAGHRWAEPYLAFWNHTFSWPFPFGLYDLSIAILLVAILAIVVLRFARSRHQEDQLKSEREAARAVQQVLIPEEIPTIHGFKIESVYKPAGEVGGDFFQILPTPANGVLIVIGDVSGKGMPAAMTVSLLVGTVRTLAHYTQSPGEILTAMNQRMLTRSQGGFTTCLVVRVDAEGTITSANAGHLAPYVDGRELPLESGLPLGLAADAAYSETAISIPPNTQLTLLTDGIVEARNSNGELFGFDRTAAISVRSTEEIARAAQAFGQEDDITVLTLAFAPAAVAHA